MGAVARAHNHAANAEANRDPTRTSVLRGRYASKLRGRFGAINTEIRDGIRSRDVLGLRDDGLLSAQANPLPSQFPRRRDRQIEAFDAWLQRQMDNEVLETIGPKHNQFVRTSYERGLAHADREARKIGLDIPNRDVATVINRPIHREELQLIYTRDYSELEGITQAVSQQSSRTLAEGLAAGENPRDIARRLTDRVDAIGKTRATTLARTSVIDTFNSAALNRYEELGAEGVSVKAEHQTAGDRRVCAECRSLAGTVYTIQEAKGRIPVHPRCRCAWVPIGQSANGIVANTKLTASPGIRARAAA
jgi:SPP1 gp7 family putative phage head morphogenesis protein